mgnify:CR=1 FL=1
MGTFIGTLGTLSIPEEHRQAFLDDAKRVASQGGLFSGSLTRIFGKQLRLLSFPSFDPEGEDKYADFTYSYYENDFWENAGIDLEDCTPYSEKIGWSQFNRTVQALYILAEIYSETPFFSYNTSQVAPSETIKWLRYVLDRDVQFTWRKDLWNVYELLAKRKIEKYGKFESGLEDILITYMPDNYDVISLTDIFALEKGVGALIDESHNKSEAENGEEKKLSYTDFMRIYRNGIKDYQKISELGDDAQIQFLLSFLTCKDEVREALSTDEYFGLKMGYTFLSPKVMVKIISEMYQRDFWQLWNTVKDNITLKPTTFFNDEKPEITSDVITTEAFFSIDAWARLYWWDDGSDVDLNEDISDWLKSKNQEFKEICSEPLSGSVNEWQKRFVTLLADHPKAFCFEDVFYEFIGNFHDNKYKAAVLLLENTAEKKEEYRHLLAVYANNKLRGTYFGF